MRRSEPSGVEPRKGKDAPRAKNWSRAALHLLTNLNIHDGERVELLKTNRVQLFISSDSPDPEELSQIRRGARWEYAGCNLKLLADHQPRGTIQAGTIHRIADIAQLAQTFNVGLIYNVVRSDVPDHRVLNRVISE